jgi:uncharacterized RDD family membrane protein YckC
MRCSQCGYHSFDSLENCKKCGLLLPQKGEGSVVPSAELDASAQPFQLASPHLPVKRVIQTSESSTPRKERVFPSFLQSRDHGGNYITGVDEEISRFASMSDESADDGDAPHYVLRRIIATIVDLVILVAIWCAFVAVGAWGLDQPILDFLHLLLENMSLRITYYLILIAAFLSYFTLLHCAGQTVGKKMVKLTVVNENGDLPCLGEGVFRTVGGLLSLLCGGWGYFRVLFDVEQRGWNDRLAGTRVVINADTSAENADPTVCELKCDEVNG